MQFSSYRTRYLFIHLVAFIAIGSLYFLSDFILEGEVRAKEVTAQATILSKYFYDAGLAMGAYSLTKNKMFAERYTKLAGQIPQALEGLHKLMDKRPYSSLMFTDIQQTTEKGLIELSNDKQIVDNDQFSSLTDDQGQARKAYKQIKLIADELQQKLDKLSGYEEEESSRISGLRFIFAILSPLCLFAYVAYNCFVQIRIKQEQ